MNTQNPRSMWRRRSLWRYELGLAMALGVCILLLVGSRVRSDLYHLTGDAEWIWATGHVQEPKPTACLFVRRFSLQHRPEDAVAKICGEPQFVLWMNGQPVVAGTNRPEYELAVISVTDLLVEGDNTIVVEARSETSVGGVLFAMDLFPTEQGRRDGDPNGRNQVVSDGRWRVLRRWSLEPSADDLEDGLVPWVWGRPPIHPWVYPKPRAFSGTIVGAARSDPALISASRAAAPRSSRRWQYRLDSRATGFLWLRIGDLAPTQLPARVEASVLTSKEGEIEFVSAAVVPVPGQQRWLFPSEIAGLRADVITDTEPPKADFVGSGSLRQH